MKTISKFFLVVLMMLTCFLKAQNFKPDSLLKLIASDNDDTAKVTHLNTMAEILSAKNSDSAFLLNIQAMKLATRSNIQASTGDCFFTAGILYNDKGNSPEAIKNLEKALEIWKDIPKNNKELEIAIEKRRAKAFSNIGIAYVRQGDYTKAIDYSLRALKMAENGNDLNGMLQYYYMLGRICWIKSDFENALGYYDKALKLGEGKQVNELSRNGRIVIGRLYTGKGTIQCQKGDYNGGLGFLFKANKIFTDEDAKNLLAQALGTTGSIYYFQGNFPKAMEYYLEALKIQEKIGDNGNLSQAVANVGLIFYEQGKYEQAIENYDRSVKLSSSVNDVKGEANAHGNLGNIYFKLNKYDKAFVEYSKALEMAEALGLKNDAALHMSNMGALYQSTNNYPKAEEYYTKSLRLANELGDRLRVAVSLQSLGSLFLSESDHENNKSKKSALFKRAEDYLSKAAFLSDSLGAIDRSKTAHLDLSTVYEKTGNLALSLFHYKKGTALKDSLFNEEKNKELTKHELEFEFEKKELATKAEQDKKGAAVLAENQKQKYILIFISAVLFLVFVFAIFAVRSLRITRKQKVIIESKNKETEQQKHIIEEKNKEMLESLRYARRIQLSLLPSEKYIKKRLDALIE